MKIENFKAGAYRRQFQYQSFSPVPVNLQWSWEEPKLNTLLEQATRALGELNAFSLIVPDVDLFIRMHVYKEANLSSRIEGTQTGMEEALMKKEQVSPEKRDDWQEVQNYVQAMNQAIEDLENIPLSNRLLKQTHATLMQGVRGQQKTPGEFRRTQNWIGGASLQDAFFVPPAPEEVPDLMGDLEKFWHNHEIDVPHLVRIAISHYQFETIHPFLDGNGRIGRLLITLYLVDKKLLAKPSLYLSAHFEKNKAAYYDSLTLVRTSNNLAHWIKFFLVAVADTAEFGKRTFQNILQLRFDVEHKISVLGKRVPSARRFLALLYREPVVDVMTVGKALNISFPTAARLMNDFVRLGILHESTGAQEIVFTNLMSTFASF